jgi:hypothetical protein
VKAPIPETPEGYLARAKAAHKLGARDLTPRDGRAWSSLGEFLHQAEIEGA